MSLLRWMQVTPRALKVLAQLAQAATTLEVLYTVPASGAKVYRVRFTNRANAAKTIRLSIALGGAANDNSQYFLYDYSLAANVSEEFEINLDLDEDDEVRVWASSADVTAAAIGTEP